MNESKRYAKIVEWSEVDGCFIGLAPDLMYGGCHGDDERKVFDELCEIVDEVIEMHLTEGLPLPPASKSKYLNASAGNPATSQTQNAAAAE